MKNAYIIDAIRTPFGRYAGGLAPVRADDLGAVPIKALMQRNPRVDWEQVDDVIYGCANQAGEDNRNVGRMSALLAGLPYQVPATTINRLCGSSLDAIAIAARAIKAGEANLVIAGGVESMSRAPYVMGKSDNAFGRSQKIEDTTMGWRFINPKLKELYGVDTMPQTAENVAEQFNVNRADQDQFALVSQQRTASAQARGFFSKEIVAVEIPQRKGDAVVIDTDEHPRASTTLEGLSKLKPVVKADGTVTAGNASGINDGAAALLIASDEAVQAYNLKPRAKIIASTAVGVEPRIMGFAPAPAIKKLLKQVNLTLEQMDVIELNEAFAAQALAVTRDLGLPDNSDKVNPNGGAIALGHPLGASGARLVTTALNQLEQTGGRYALCSMCIGVGQGIALIIERVEAL
ncbi:TPA: 3-oxoadipyl-CoA thiolase [Acinetobacter baumannii]|uniref:Beta-ketoadipyl-CoA thiolase n=48 Tax=Gammaproteobacteria TaxID=1236 RepID=A0A237XX70_ACIBA|nr:MULTISPECIES: 3-oxoadipyl-CoA thiolase [Acinetobacter]AHX27962.1 beta-ketoadipyl CoA thiolase [Acinetobacter baumannii AC12]AHX64733.1 beta-ketoadipyl CoA thiolase [Acinetobacter baumannii AC30]EMT84934.1 beta-ketoadipyl CoA thiolase [Acinetobacter baumannii ABNIH5]EXC93601.1 3-oxoadipyl-CoA thiolase [Acinetobacter baumannii 1051830]EXD23055.1 3-oxoadipyl-CoA thiolase [Acinetobacter baumannii 34654]EYU47492.1 3-oxoadipyl-CoA thiolase [Acinetobacter baumannii 1457504]KCW29067.1 3-oxoadipyl